MSGTFKSILSKNANLIKLILSWIFNIKYVLSLKIYLINILSQNGELCIYCSLFNYFGRSLYIMIIIPKVLVLLFKMLSTNSIHIAGFEDSFKF